MASTAHVALFGLGQAIATPPTSLCPDPQGSRLREIVDGFEMCWNVPVYALLEAGVCGMTDYWSGGSAQTIITK